MTPFGLWLHLCGLSQREAAATLGVSLRSVEDYCAGRRRCPPGVIADLRALRARIKRAADEMLDGLEEAIRAAREIAPGTPLRSVDVGCAVDDHEAQSLGWPCLGAHRASLALVLESLPPEIDVCIVPRGSTPVAAAAADAHGR